MPVATPSSGSSRGAGGSDTGAGRIEPVPRAPGWEEVVLLAGRSGTVLGVPTSAAPGQTIVGAIKTIREKLEKGEEITKVA